MSEQALIHLTIDGKEVEVPQGSTILDAAKKLGIEIPTLCHNDALHPYGSCWVCAVKVEGARTMVPSCSTEVREGMIVTNDDAEVRNTRKLCLELLLSDHTGDCFGPCHDTCPAGIDVQGYLALVRNGEYSEALRLIKEKNPLPLICGRVCPRPCEDKCRRNLVDEPVAVDAVKRFVADWDLEHGHWQPPVATATGKKVAIVGGGPAGLTAAYFLAQRGHACTILEAQPQLGGMLRWGIPAYRLPREVLDAEIENITSLGVTVEYGKRMGTDFTVQQLHDKDGYDAVFVAIGATESRLMGVEGEDLDGVMPATGFLLRFGLGETFAFKGKKVVIVGGGNSAIDAARTSLRLGASSVTLMYRRSRAEMPAQDIEVEDAEHEGVQFHFLVAPTKLMGTGKLEKIEYVRMELGEPDASGRRRPQEVAGSESIIDADICIAAIGQTPDMSAVENSVGLTKTKWGAIGADPKSLRCGAEWLFAGGDCVNGAATVVESVAHGREAAISIDRYMNGLPITRTESIFAFSQGGLEDLNPADFDHFLRAPRHTMSCMDLTERLLGFSEVEKGLSEAEAQEEAKRCLSCGCDALHDCRVRRYADQYHAEHERFKGDHRKEEVDLRHPLVKLETQKCIMCGACVRVCDEIRDIRALSFSQRGFSARVRPVFGDSLLDTDCISCGACIDICPTGAIVEKMDRGIFPVTSTPSTCTGCGVGCATVNQTSRAGTIATIAGEPLQAPNFGQLCLRGRFGHRCLDGAERITTPMIRQDGALVATDWNTALTRARDLIKAEAGALPVYCSPHASTEEITAAAAIATSTPHGSLLSMTTQDAPALKGMAAVLGSTISPLGVEALATADVVVLIACDPHETHPVAAVAMHRTQPDMKLIAIGDLQGKLQREAVLKLRPKTETTPLVVSHIAAALDGKTEDIESRTEIGQGEIADVVALLENAKRPVLVIDCARAGTQLATAAAQLAVAISKKAPPLLALQQAANSTTFAACGGVETDRALPAGTALAIREDIGALTPNMDDTRWIVCDCVMGSTSAMADVILPVPAPHELNGTIQPTGTIQKTLQAETTAAAAPEATQTMAQLISILGLSINKAETCAPATTEAKDISVEEESLRTRKPSADTFTRRFQAWASSIGVR